MKKKAYQEIRDAFETDVVRIFVCLPDMEFETMNLDKSKQIAELYYSYDGETIGYIINVPYSESSLGIDFEDPIEKEYSETIDGCEIKVTIYKLKGVKNLVVWQNLNMGI